MGFGPLGLPQLLILLLLVSFLVFVVVGVVWLIEKVGGNKSVGCGCVLASGGVFLACLALLSAVMAANW